MSTAEQVAKAIVSKGARDAGEKLRKLRQNVDSMWAEAFAIPAGCGCTPFYADAREAEDLLKKALKEFEKRYGEKELKKLNIRMRE